MGQGEASGLQRARITDPEHPVPIPEDAIREELSRVLAGHEFRSSKRSQEFLRFVVDHTLGGRSDVLKERTIGIEVFGRSSDYDPSEDATVRVKAGEVRKRLGLYYAGEGLLNPLRIELPAGTYVPEFRRHASRVDAPVNDDEGLKSVETPVIATPLAAGKRLALNAPSRRWSKAGLLIAGCALVLAIAAVAIWLSATRTDTRSAALNQFWAPVLQGAAPVSVCAAFVPVYWPDRRVTAKEPLRVQDFTLLTDQFVGGGDLIAVSRVTSLLTRRSRAFHVRIGNETSLRDLETAPAIMVGYSYTRWKDISNALRFFIDGSRQPIGITDYGAPTKWSLPGLPPDRHTTEDYAIVSRVFHPDTHAMLVEIAGITQYGTDAASDLVTNPDLMADALRNAPHDWQHKNLQMVLHVKVISEAPSSPIVVATHFW